MGIRFENGLIAGASGRRYRRSAELAEAEKVLLPYPDADADSLPPMLTRAGRAAAELFFSGEGKLEVLRGEPGEFILFSRRLGGSFTIAALACESTTLTVRVEDVWERLPAAERAFEYTATTLRDPTPADSGTDAVQESFPVAPDARIFIDIAAHGGFTIAFR